MSKIRYSVKPRDAPPAIAARALGLTLDQFSEKLPTLISRGFPKHDPTTGHYDLKAIEAWQDRRHPQLFHSEAPPIAPTASSDTRERIRMMSKPS